MKRMLQILGVIGLILIAVLFFNRGNIKRLLTVNSLFNADKIVHNFSNMDEVLFARELNISGEAHQWPVAIQPLPENVDIVGKPRSVTQHLDMTSTTAFVVVKDGTIISEAYYQDTAMDDRRISWSMAKSFLAILYGQAVEGGQIKSLEDAVSDYVPSLVGSAYEGVSIRNVMHMASGVKFSEDYLDQSSDINKMGRVLALGGSMDEFAATLKEQKYEPGSARQYVSIDTHVLAMVLRAATGKSLHTLFEETYGANLGFGKAPYYSTDGKGQAFALGGLNMRTRDYALFGQLLLDGGKTAAGKQIVSEDWIKAATVQSAPENVLGGNDVGYGYQIWVPRPYQGDYFAVGIYGQYIYVDPSRGIVIAKNSAHREFLDNGPSGEPFIIENIAFFRSLADHYAPQD